MNMTNTLRTRRLQVALVVLGLAMAAGCAKKAEQATATAAGFDTPEQAVQAFVAALE